MNLRNSRFINIKATLNLTSFWVNDPFNICFLETVLHFFFNLTFLDVTSLSQNKIFEHNPNYRQFSAFPIISKHVLKVTSTQIQFNNH